MLTAEPVFAGGPVEVLAQQLGDEPTPLTRRTDRHVDPGLEALVMECLRKDPEQRPVDAREIGRRIAATGLAGRWTETECRAWWRDHAPEVLGEPVDAVEDSDEVAQPSVGTTLRDDEDTAPAPPEPSFFRRRAARRREAAEETDERNDD
jgi:hypothetical protein